MRDSRNAAALLAGGTQAEWGFEAHSPNLVARKGWNVGTLGPGDKITMRSIR